jgi:hypothetical protein
LLLSLQSTALHHPPGQKRLQVEAVELLRVLLSNQLQQLLMQVEELSVKHYVRIFLASWLLQVLPWSMAPA